MKKKKMNQLSELFLSQSLRLVQSQRCSLKLSRPPSISFSLETASPYLVHEPLSQTLSLKLSNSPIATITSQTQTPISQSIV